MSKHLPWFAPLQYVHNQQPLKTDVPEILGFLLSYIDGSNFTLKDIKKINNQSVPAPII